MNVSYQWLKSLADVQGGPREIADQLAMYGAPVDEIVDIGGPLRDVRIARVVEVRRHPKADRLSLCRVDAGAGELLDVVCGAPNVQAERYYPYIPEGGELPGGIRIERRKIRGEESRGMLCSPRELGLGRDHEGILELHGTFTPGAPFTDAVQLDDFRLVVDVTPNRPDLLSHFGIARELSRGGAAALVLPAFPLRNGHPPALTFEEDRRASSTGGVTVTVEDSMGCPIYSGTAIRGVTVGPSPEWLASRLRAIGLRPINNVVDATNYVLHELGQPLHAFDLERLGGQVVIRQARAGETLVTLDGAARELEPGSLVIADATRPIALAGVMGGADTEVTEETREIFLEAALFDPAAVRRTRRAVGLSTDASYRFERGVDPEGIERAVRRAVELIQSVAGGTVVPAVATVRARQSEPRYITLRESRIEQTLGVKVDLRAAAAYLGAIGFDIADTLEDSLVVRVPGHRVYDVHREEDLVEEVARRHGYTAFPDDLRPYRPSVVPADALAILEDRLRTQLVGRGFLEARSAAFATPEEGDVALLFPLSSAESRLRRALLPGLVHRLEANFNRGARDLRLFEIGTVFSTGVHSPLPAESTRLAAVMTGARTPHHWSGEAAMFDVWDLKGVAESMAEALDLTVEPGHDPGSGLGVLLDAQSSFRLVARGAEAKSVGAAGPLLPGAIDSPPWAAPVFALEVDLSVVQASAPTEFAELPAYPAIERDIALLVPHGIAAGRLEATIRTAAGELLEHAGVFDVYEGRGLPEDARSIAFRLRFRSLDRTLTDAEIDAVLDRVLRRLRDEHQVERRG